MFLSRDLLDISPSLTEAAGAIIDVSPLLRFFTFLIIDVVVVEDSIFKALIDCLGEKLDN